jgi:tetrahydrodipicolinate N-succinyltransferase
VGQWTVHQWIKKAVLLSFRLNDNRVMGGGNLLRQGAHQVRRHERRAAARHRRARGAAGRGAPRQLQAKNVC